MTICIAATCEKRSKIIVCSDRMITASHLSQEFEHNIPKMEEVCTSCLAVTAGAALVPRELFSNVRTWASTVSNPKISEVVDKVKENFNKLRIKKAEERYIKSRGFKNVADFYEKSMGLPLQLVVPLDQNIAQEQLEVEILVAGVDADGAHVYLVRDPGASDCFDSIGYSAVGSGEPHALHTFIAEEYDSDSSLNNALFVVYEAKRNAENAPGVGTNTDLWVVDKNGIKKVDQTVLVTLDKIYNSKKALLKESNKQIYEEIKNLKI